MIWIFRNAVLLKKRRFFNATWNIFEIFQSNSQVVVFRSQWVVTSILYIFSISNTEYIRIAGHYTWLRNIESRYMYDHTIFKYRLPRHVPIVFFSGLGCTRWFPCSDLFIVVYVSKSYLNVKISKAWCLHYLSNTDFSFLIHWVLNIEKRGVI